MLKPKNIEKRKRRIILEFKIINEKDSISENEIQEKLQKESEIALKQIAEKEYISALKNAEVEFER